jgi:hypothetical protein
MTRKAVLGCVALLCCVGCQPRAGMNSSCVWPFEPVSTLDLSRDTDRRHLVDDVRIAEELGIRYVDAKGKFRPDWLQIRSGCEDRLFTAIAHAHGVPLVQVLEARQRLGDATFDWVATLPTVLIYIIGSWTMAGWIPRRFSPGGGLVALVGVGVISVMITITAMMVGNLLEAVVWMLRMASTHASYRALRPTWTSEHRQELFGVGVVVFWIVALMRYQLTLRTVDATTARSRPPREFGGNRS